MDIDNVSPYSLTSGFQYISNNSIFNTIAQKLSSFSGQYSFMLSAKNLCNWKLTFSIYIYTYALTKSSIMRWKKFPHRDSWYSIVLNGKKYKIKRQWENINTRRWLHEMRCNQSTATRTDTESPADGYKAAPRIKPIYWKDSWEIDN